MTAADAISLVKELGPTLGQLAILVTALGAWRQGKKNRKAITENTTITQGVQSDVAAAKAVVADQGVKMDVVHGLVNNLSTDYLRQLSDSHQRIYELSGLDADRIIADTSRRKWQEKLQTDKEVAIKEADGIARVAAERNKMGGQD